MSHRLLFLNCIYNAILNNIVVSDLFNGRTIVLVYILILLRFFYSSLFSNDLIPNCVSPAFLSIYLISIDCVYTFVFLSLSPSPSISVSVFVGVHVLKLYVGIYSYILYCFFHCINFHIIHFIVRRNSDVCPC
jgi:hypothetical protein